MKKKRILMILHLPPPIHGAAMMGKFIKESVLINSMFEIDHINLSTSVTLNEIGKGGIRKLVAFYNIVSKVVRALFRKKYDLCYITLNSSESGFYKDSVIVALLKLARIKIIYHLHNKGVASRQARLVDNVLYKLAFSGTRTILLSPLLYLDIQKYVKREDVFFCPNGIPVTNLSVPLRNHQNNGKRCRLLFLSHMMVEKGVYTLLDACRLLKNSNNNFECHFVGSWSNISKIDFDQRVSDLQLNGCVYAHGPKFGAEKEKHFLDADIFVFPTSYERECFSLVLLEAMSYGLPVVSTTQGGIPDIVVNGETGYLVTKNDHVTLAEKLRVLLDSPELRSEFGKAGKARFASHFTINEFEKNISNIFSLSVA